MLGTSLRGRIYIFLVPWHNTELYFLLSEDLDNRRVLYAVRQRSSLLASSRCGEKLTPCRVGNTVDRCPSSELPNFQPDLEFRLDKIAFEYSFERIQLKIRCLAEVRDKPRWFLVIMFDPTHVPDG